VYVSGNHIDQNPIKVDSLAWKCQAAGDFTCAGTRVRHALLLSHRKNHYQICDHTPDNDDPSVGPD
jgi:hypothetical protein